MGSQLCKAALPDSVICNPMKNKYGPESLELVNRQPLSLARPHPDLDSAPLVGTEAAAPQQQEQPEQQEAPPPAQEMLGAQAGTAEAAAEGSSREHQPKPQVTSKPKVIAATATTRDTTTQKAEVYCEQKPPLHPNDSAGLVIHTPMVKVGGPAGPMPVFREWSEKDIEEAMALLPAVVGHGVEFAKELDQFCCIFRPTGYEIRRLMSKKLNPADLSRIAASLPPAEVRVVDQSSLPSSAGGERSSPSPNAAYYLAVMKLCKAIETVFPPKPNLRLLNSVKQHPDEPVFDFLHRMQEAFEKHSGMIKPAEKEIPNSPWQQMVVDRIVAGLRPDLLVEVEQQYVFLRLGISLKDLRRHCLHAEDVVKDRLSKEKAQRERQLRQAATTIYSVMLEHASHPARGRAGSRSRDDKLPRTREGGRCYSCGRFGHWRRDCPHLQTSNPQTPRSYRGQADERTPEQDKRGAVFTTPALKSKVVKERFSSPLHCSREEGPAINHSFLNISLISSPEGIQIVPDGGHPALMAVGYSSCDLQSGMEY